MNADAIQVRQARSDDRNPLVFVLGYPDYHSRFGFVPAGVRGFQAPYHIPEKNADAWMVLELQAGALEEFEGTIKCCEALDHQKYWVE